MVALTGPPVPSACPAGAPEPGLGGGVLPAPPSLASADEASPGLEMPESVPSSSGGEGATAVTMSPTESGTTEPSRPWAGPGLAREVVSGSVVRRVVPTPPVAAIVDMTVWAGLGAEKVDAEGLSTSGDTALTEAFPTVKANSSWGRGVCARVITAKAAIVALAPTAMPKRRWRRWKGLWRSGSASGSSRVIGTGISEGGGGSLLGSDGPLFNSDG